MNQSTTIKKKKSKIGTIVSWVLGSLIALLFVVEASGFITARSNYGVPNFFGYQTMTVLTDSMEPVMPVGVGIIVQKVDVTTLKASSEIENHDGDIISFYNPNAKVIITHRIIDIIIDGNDNYTFYTLGDNLEAESCYVNFGHACDYSNYDVVPERYVLGKVIEVSKPIGVAYQTLSNVYLFPIVVLIPLLWVFISAMRDIIKGTKEENTATGVNGDSLKNDNISDDDDFEDMKQREKLRILVEMEKEKLRQEMNIENREEKDEEKRKE
ncbi:MAG TPA: S26 family signal peptidase [Bacilli bacterium]|nr:S26 family signal peptidase [Bacilli bacterium]